MVKVDLITGFLGSGKTTFIKKYAKYLMDSGENICILENDFGAVNVDMMLLQDLMGEKCELEMVAGGCDEDCHRRRFKTKLISMGMCGYDRVLIEPSGIFDVDEFFDILREEPLDRWYEIGSVFTIVDAGLNLDLSESSRYMLAQQLTCAGKVLMSRTQCVSEVQEKATENFLQNALEEFQCNRVLEKDICRKNWNEMQAEDFEELIKSGYRTDHCVKFWMDQREAYSSVYYMNLPIQPEELKKAAEAILKDEECGRVFRIKGFLKEKDESWLECNITHDQMSVEPIANGQEVIIVIGEQLNQEKIDQYLKK